MDELKEELHAAVKLSLYLDLAAQLEQEINRNVRRLGDKMPSLRQFARQYSVSMTTAVRTYEQLQDSGFLIARPKSGFFVNRPQTPSNGIEFIQFKSAISSMSTPSSMTHGQLNNKLAMAHLAPSLIPFQQLQRSMKYALSGDEALLFGYGDVQGNVYLRQCLAEHFSKNGFAVPSAELLITTGCISAVTLAIESVTKPGDTVAVSSPCYQGLLQVLALLDRKVLEIPSTPQGLDVTQLESLAKQGCVDACLFTANHQNPTGHCLSVEQKQWLADFAVRFKIPLIEDDVFGELAHFGSPPLPIKAFDKCGYVLWCSSVSKSLAPGLRLGWCWPGRYSELLVQRHKTTSMGLNQANQLGLARFMQTGHYVRHVKSTNKLLAEHVKAYRQFFAEQLKVEYRLSNPAGGMVLWLKLPGIDCNKLSMNAGEQGLALRCGHLFTSRQLYGDHLRINIGWPLDQIKVELTMLVALINATR